jgi:hypothetical protein
MGGKQKRSRNLAVRHFRRENRTPARIEPGQAFSWKNPRPNAAIRAGMPKPVLPTEIADRHKPEAPGAVCRAPSGVAGLAEAAGGGAPP